MRRFYFQGQVKIDTVIKIENELFNHIINVVKIKKGENFIIFNSESGNYFCVLKNIEKRFGEAKVLYKIPENEKNSSNYNNHIAHTSCCECSNIKQCIENYF